jgi:hypothetical protein
VYTDFVPPSLLLACTGPTRPRGNLPWTSIRARSSGALGVHLPQVPLALLSSLLTFSSPHVATRMPGRRSTNRSSMQSCKLSGLSAFNGGPGPSSPSAAAALAIALTAPALSPILPVPAPPPRPRIYGAAASTSIIMDGGSSEVPGCQISAFTHSVLPKRPPSVQSQGPSGPGPSSISAGCRR